MKELDLTNTKVKVGEHSRQIQKKAFELGWAWGADRPGTTRHEDAPCLFFRADKNIFRSYVRTSFEESPFREITPEEILGDDDQWMTHAGDKEYSETRRPQNLKTLQGTIISTGVEYDNLPEHVCKIQEKALSLGYERAEDDVELDNDICWFTFEDGVMSAHDEYTDVDTCGRYRRIELEDLMAVSVDANTKELTTLQGAIIFAGMRFKGFPQHLQAIQDKAKALGWKRNPTNNIDDKDIKWFTFGGGVMTAHYDMSTDSVNEFRRISLEELMKLNIDSEVLPIIVENPAWKSEEWIPKRGDLVGTPNGVRIYVATVEGAMHKHILVQTHSEQKFKEGKPFGIYMQETISRHHPKTIVTLEEIAEWKGVDVNQIEIKE